MATRLLLGFAGGLFAFDPEARGEVRTLLPGLQAMALASDPGNPARIYCATYNRGLWRSEDFGESWLPIGTPQNFFRGPTPGDIDLRETTFVSVSPHPDAGGRHAVWVGTEPSRLYRSGDHGETFALVSALDLPSRSTWSFPPRPRTNHVQCIAHTSEGRIHLAIEAGAMIRSRDGGKTFADRLPDSPLDTHVLATHPLEPEALYAALGDAYFGLGRSFAESHNGGDIWRYLGKGLESAPYLYGLALHPENIGEMKVSAASSPRTAHVEGGSTIFRREGDVWSEDAQDFPSDRSLIPILTADASCPGRWFALSNLGLFAQEPRSRKWTCLAAPASWRSLHPTALTVVNLGAENLNKVS
jgi:hypothetical protein